MLFVDNNQQKFPQNGKRNKKNHAYKVGRANLRS